MIASDFLLLPKAVLCSCSYEDASMLAYLSRWSAALRAQHRFCCLRRERRARGLTADERAEQAGASARALVVVERVTDFFAGEPRRCACLHREEPPQADSGNAV